MTDDPAPSPAPPETPRERAPALAASERLRRQMAFIVEADRLKQVFRQSYISDGTRKENDAEHSWHLCLMAITLFERADDPTIDLLKILKMAILHDIVEIDAGDTYIYDYAAKAAQAEREARAADRLFGLLPGDQAREFRALWEEFEAGQSKEARFAKAIDRLHPMLLNYLCDGRAWNEHGVSAPEVRAINQRIELGSAALWDYAQELIRDAVEQGRLTER